MKAKVKPCSTVGNAFMVVVVSKFGKETTKAIGLTKLEAISYAKQLNS